MTHPLLTVFACAIAVAVAGCSDRWPPDDAGDTGAPPDGPITDARVDALPDVPAALFGQCASDSDCPDEPGASCLTSYSGGLCTHRCDTTSDCGNTGVCVYRLCLPECGAIGSECDRYQSACAGSPDGVSNEHSCRPNCFAADRTPFGTPACGAGLQCDEFSGACTAMPFTTGRENGEPCRDGDECRSGWCVGEVRAPSGEPSGYIGGYCASLGRMPPPGAFVDGGHMPRWSCPAGSVVIPDPSLRAGDQTACLRECMADGDCREGYYCEQFEGQLEQHFTSGVCIPINCATSARTCPAGYTCTPRAGTSVSVCARSM